MGSLIFWGGPGWDDATVWLYIGISCIAGLFSFLAARSKSVHGLSLFYVLAVVTLVLFKGLCVSGVDVRFNGGYYLNFISAEGFSSFRDKSVELGFQMLTICIRSITDKYEIYLLVMAALSVVPVMYVFWKLRGKINLPFAVMGYSLIFMVTGMSAMRQFIAVGLCLLAAYYYLIRRYVPSLVVAALAVSVHLSALCYSLLLLLALMKGSRKLQLLVAVIVVAAFTVLQGATGLLLTGRYSIYALSGSTGFGVAVLLKYVPVLVLLAAAELHAKKLCPKDSERDIALSYCWSVLLFAICIALIGYSIPILGRAESFSLPIVIVIAYLVRICEDNRFFRIPVKVLVFLYFCFRLLLYMNDAFLSEGLMPYQTWF